MYNRETSRANAAIPAIKPMPSPSDREALMFSGFCFVALGNWLHCDVTSVAMATKHDVTNKVRVDMTTGSLYARAIYSAECVSNDDWDKGLQLIAKMYAAFG